jgi:hypothetical protein
MNIVIDKPSDNSIKLKIVPYIGPHNAVGIDYIYVTVDSSGGIKIDKFEHIEGFELPPNYENIIKKKYW